MPRQFHDHIVLFKPGLFFWYVGMFYLIFFDVIAGTMKLHIEGG
jgi:hypothetical protein